MLYSYITTLANWVYIEKEVVFAYIYNPKICISKIIDLIRPVDKWSEIVFSGRQMPKMDIEKHKRNLYIN